MAAAARANANANAKLTCDATTTRFHHFNFMLCFPVLYIYTFRARPTVPQ